jgi:hypothetical protein
MIVRHYNRNSGSRKRGMRRIHPDTQYAINRARSAGMLPSNAVRIVDVEVVDYDLGIVFLKYEDAQGNTAYKRLEGIDLSIDNYHASRGITGIPSNNNRDVRANTPWTGTGTTSGTVRSNRQRVIRVNITNVPETAMIKLDHDFTTH